jgi:DNA-binding HxlR family transcriptional regulator
MRWEELDQQPCSLARALSVLGDRWTLLVLRECFLGIRRFDGFEQRLGITRHVLADRLKKLVEAGLLSKEAYQQRPLREEYRLTAKGLDLYPVMLALANWGDRHMSGTQGPPLRHVHRSCGRQMHGVLVCSECGEALAPGAVRLEEAPGLEGQVLPAHWQQARGGEST